MVEPISIAIGTLSGLIIGYISTRSIDKLFEKEQISETKPNINNIVNSEIRENTQKTGSFEIIGYAILAILVIFLIYVGGRIFVKCVKRRANENAVARNRPAMQI